MLVLVRRFAVLAALAFWQGGFTFYAAVVVHVGAQVLGEHLDQGFITQRVTNYLNLVGAVALPILAWDIAASIDAVRWRRWARWVVWTVLAVTLVALVWMHTRLDGHLDAEVHEILDRDVFVELHRLYLHVSTVQWVAGLIGLAQCVWMWRADDSRLASGGR
jgi:hypothetical protein